MDSGCKCLNHSLTSPCKDWEKFLMQTSTCSTPKRSRKCSKDCRCFLDVRFLDSPSNLGRYLWFFAWKSWRIGGRWSGLYRFGILEETRLCEEDIVSTVVSWSSQICSLMSCSLDKRYWSKSYAQDEEILLVWKEGYIGVNSWFGLECNKQWGILLTNLGKDQENIYEKG